ncbi:MAG: hypothetical protein IJR77_01735 [Bacteroidales bacterium]|nr:hypothetical protein [Bacteroidales bacterium]
MSTPFEAASLHYAGLCGDTNIYELESQRLLNRYFILSGPGSRRLLAFPEVIGFPCYTALVPETVAALSHLFPSGQSGDIDILTILRGGLNYPLEEACFRTGIPVRNMHFVSCERVIKDHVITGLEIHYEKISPAPDRILAIGDILATGDTLRLCLEHIASAFHRGGGSIRRILFFTIGGTRAFALLEELTERFRTMFPGFEGFDCFFYEGMFTVYTDKGVSGINVPNIDFGWKGGLVSPEFRRFIMDNPDALFEKCIIYDGGARRYEIPIHFAEVLEYWEGILSRAEKIDPLALLSEKLGYDGPISFDRWLEVTGFGNLPVEGLHALWAREQDLFRTPVDLAALAERRIQAITKLQNQYGKA